MKHLEVRQKYSAASRIFNSLLGVSSGDETLRLMFDILHETLHLMFDILLELQQTKHRRSFFLVRRAKPARQENDQSAALVFRALGARARVHFSH